MNILPGVFERNAKSGLIKGGSEVVDEFVATIVERRAADHEQPQAQREPPMVTSAEREAQIKLNVMEAQHSSLFVAAWRPAVGWVCALALLWQYILSDLIRWSLVLFGITVDFINESGETVQVPADLPELKGTDDLLTLLLALLGVAGIRSAEKYMGVAREMLKPK